MKIIINNDIVEFENKKENVEKIVESINQRLKENELDLSHLVIDGNYIDEELYQYLTDNILTIQEIVVVVKTPELIVNETLDSAYNYIANAVLLIKPLAEAFYQHPKQDSWKNLANLFEGIQWIMETVNRIDNIENLKNIVINYQIWNEYVQTIKGLSAVIIELEDAMVNQDQVLIGDLLQYEIQAIFETSEEKLQFLIPTGGRHHVS
ncbi:hypothetical protein GH811_05505 [Acetobacterium malicum]|uniref:Uncharacterized protein n=1 Tax=Acetobacterium malicum TaxID=52692 RepID=A0ABR6YV86_9FIRM|nr:hypothetical protein [Acetobacterium malicum]MBC3899069.1 hypothetical protein [Acetobacterium malicum]